MAEQKTIKSYILKRIIHAVPLLLCVVTFNFVLLHLAPGDPVQALVGEFPAPPALVEEIKKAFGLDQPLYVQLGVYLRNIARGDLGYSFYYRQPVLDVIVGRIPATLELMLPALIFSALVGVWLGILSAKKPYSLFDNVFSLFALIGYCLPVFWLGQMLMLFFSIQLSWLPAQGRQTLGVDLAGFAAVRDRAAHMILPVLALALRHLAINARVMRASMLEVSFEDYVVLARAKGLANNRVVFSHMVPNALLPVVTIIGLDLGFIFTGALLVETVFGWPGIGRLMYESILRRDYPVLMANLLITTVLVVAVNLIVDVIYAWLDPRVKYGE